jgi:hypothetical protein
MKTHRNSNIMAILIISLIASASLAQATPGNGIDEPDKNLTREVEYTLERTAIVAVRHITQARSDIHRKELPKARLELEKAESLMETIKNDLSTTTVKNFIWIARKHLEYEQPQQVLHDFPQIYSSLEMISVYIPTEKARMYVDRAKGYLEMDKKWEAERALGLAEKSLIVIEVELPLLKTQRYVTLAQEYLVKNNPQKADEALRTAEQRAMALYFGMNSPVIQARQNVWLAFRNYSSATHAESGWHLKEARSYLEKVVASGNSKGKEEMSKLSKEISVLENKLAAGEKVAESDLKVAWEKSEALAERSAAYIATRISEAETTLGVESNLIEAKLHVTYAEIYQVTTYEPNKAVKEIDIALSLLQKATESPLVDSDESKKIKEIRNILIDLKLMPKERDITVKDRYESVKDDLRTLTANERSAEQVREIQNN